MMPTGTQLPKAQLDELTSLIQPYLQQIQQLEQKLAMLRGAANAIGGAYLRGLGIKEQVNIDLATGLLTPLAVAPSVNHDESPVPSP